MIVSTLYAIILNRWRKPKIAEGWAYENQNKYGSVNTAGIIAPAIVAAFVSTLTAVVLC